MKTFCERQGFYYMDCSLQILNFKFISLTLRIKIALKRHNIKVQMSSRKGCAFKKIIGEIILLLAFVVIVKC